jgi:hypothetical protein
VEQRSEWDMQIEVTELPSAFRATVDSLPADVPYVHIPLERVDWAAKQFPARKRFRMGLCGRQDREIRAVLFHWISSRRYSPPAIARFSAFKRART